MAEGQRETEDRDGGRESAAGKNRINSVLRAIELLQLYTKEDRELGITEISKRMGLYKSSVYRIVRTLEYAGWLEQNPENGKYKLGMKIMDVGSTLLRSYDYRDTISRGMRELADQVHETVVLSAYTDLWGICVDVIESENHIAYTSRLGQKTPVYSGATGKILLAWQEEAEIRRVLSQELKRYTPHTVTDRDRLWEEIAEIREKGYALSMEETDVGVGAIGAPLFDRQGRMIYGVSIVGPAERLKKKGIGRLTDVLLAKCGEITEQIKLLS